MNEISIFLTKLFGDELLAAGIFMLMSYIVYFSIRKTFSIWFQEKRNPNTEDIVKMLKNAGAIVIMMMGLHLSINVVKKINLPAQEDKHYRAGIVMLFLIPSMQKVIDGKDFVS